MAVAGDLFGARQEKVMSRVPGTDLFYHSQKLDKDLRVSYLFIKDYADMFPDPKNDDHSKIYILGQDMEFSFGGDPLTFSVLTMPEWKPPVAVDASPAKKGELASHTLTSAVMEKEHEVKVYLPAGYEESDARYPMLVVHYGREAIDKGDLVQTLDGMIGSQIEPVVAVFIMEQPNRPGPKYMQMLGDELLPFIEKTYRVSAEPSARANIGIGLGSGAAISTTLAHPDKFRKTGMNSVFVFDSGFPGLEKAASEAESAGDHMVYIDWAAYDLRNPQEEWDLRIFAKKMSTMLKDQGFKVRTREFPEGFGWTSWRGRTPAMLQALFPLGNL
jgi:enterochelin esterase-like enzyme